MTILEGRAAIVTGASRGIGAAVARRLGRDGWAVVVNYRADSESALEVVDSIESAGGRAVAIQADVGDPGDVCRLFDIARERFGHVAALVNNAAVNEFRPVDAIEGTLIDRVFRANIAGVLLATAEFARRFEGDDGRIVNLSSGAARGSQPGTAVYGASKAAVEAATRVAAAELGPRGVTVNAVAPGATETEMFIRQVPELVRSRLVSATMLGRLGRPDDIAAVIAFLCSAEGSWLTGQVLDANGGRLV